MTPTERLTRLVGHRRIRVIRRCLLRGAYCRERGWYAEGERWARRADETVRRTDPAGRVPLLVELATLWHGLTRYEEAYRCARRAVESLTPAPAEARRDRALADALVLMGDVARRRARYDEAETRLCDALALLEEADHLRQATVRLGLGVLGKETGRHEEAAVWYRQALSRLKRHGGSPLMEADALHNLAGLAHARGAVGGEEHARAAIEIRRGVLGPAHPQVAGDLAVLGSVLAAEGRHAEAEDALRRALDIFRDRLGAGHYEVAVCQVNLARLDALQGRAEEAERRYREALAIKRRVLGDDHPEVERLAAAVGATPEGT
ncbi:tetratricopeptide repeat protein [Streptosporangium sp. NPDC023615]|uniref:tetratricopeptide repeat protein n=1 Tax=Streptosporangium sp. NPDC023615 TaxID=3154794 RepID=UPI00342EEA24